ncbi:MAG: HWE histidine kinase domain-containing protein [Phycisphaerales bacterium]|jgi:two-component sensor histidine kinase|nr:HWE histidine kinase domain-containing protein [Phycisphaerales bacterium]
MNPQIFANTHLSTAFHNLQDRGHWQTSDITPNAATVLGVPADQLMEDPSLWAGRVHPEDLDAVSAALRSADPRREHSVTYRFRDAREHYRWIGFKFLQSQPNAVVGVLSDATQSRVMAYRSRLLGASRDGLSTLLAVDDLSEVINRLLERLGMAMAVRRGMLVRLRRSGKAFVTHAWARVSSDNVKDMPMEIPSEGADWWLGRLRRNPVLLIENINAPDIPAEAMALFGDDCDGAALVAGSFVNGKLEAFACFQASTPIRRWTPEEQEAVAMVLSGLGRRIEFRVEDRRQQAAELELRRSEARYRFVTHHSPVVLFGIDAAGMFTLSEGRGLGALATKAGDVVGHSAYEVYRNHPDMLRLINEAMTGQEVQGTVPVGDSTFEVWMTPVRGADNVVSGLSGVAVDVTRRHELEQQQKFMMRELDHRVKNNIASIISLVELSRSGDQSMDEFAATISGRLQAMAVAHAALARTRWGGAWMRDILQLTLQPFMQGNDGRIRFEGPDVELAGALARPMCMAIHELAANAVKHGALSTQQGIITLTTELLQGDTCMRFTWGEQGGSPPATIEPGTGISLLRGLVHHEMRGDIDVSADGGLTCTMEIPLEREDTIDS